jgi:hypothetical protein
MKLSIIGVPGIPLGKHNVKDPRLDQVDKLVEADKKAYIQIDTVGEDEMATADAFLVSSDRMPDLILQDLEFIETRLGREPEDAEKNVLLKLKSVLENEQWVSQGGLSETEQAAIAAHAFVTTKPIVVATTSDLEHPEVLIVRAYRESGFISFLTVGGKENRAWKIRQGANAWEAAGVIHSDIQKGFIRAEVISFADLVQAGGETQAKRANKQRLETKAYILQDYDVVNFRFNKT